VSAVKGITVGFFRFGRPNPFLRSILTYFSLFCALQIFIVPYGTYSVYIPTFKPMFLSMDDDVLRIRS